MSYSVYVQKFLGGEPSAAEYRDVVSVLSRYGSVGRAGGRLEFTPDGSDVCEVGFVGGSEGEGVDSIGFERPVYGGRLAHLVFELLGVSGMCYFEQDGTFVLARSDVTPELPEGLVEMCEDGRVTVIASAAEVPL